MAPKWKKQVTFGSNIMGATCTIRLAENGQWEWSASRYNPHLRTRGFSPTKQSAKIAARKAAEKYEAQPLT